jgi:hypothetical protein
MNIENFIQTDWDGNTVDMVRTDDGNGNLIVMTKATYDAQLASQENN